MTPQRQICTLPAYTTVAGRTLKNVQVGYETYGALNAARDNAILICHYFSGTAHAAGRYSESDPLPGWWDAAIGPGKAIDTNRYFVVCSDSLCCLKVFDGQVVTTGPASINPDTGKPYGRDFPLTGVSDMVRVQKALLDHLGIERLVAVAGPSAGSVKALQWAVEFPEMTPRVIAAISPGLVLSPWARTALQRWCSPILVDAAWKNGAYDIKEQPLRGMTEAYRLTFLDAVSEAWMEKTFGGDWADPTRDPSMALENEFKAYAGIGVMAAASAAITDANHYLYMVRAATTYNVLPRIGEARAKFLFLPAESDILVPPFISARAVEQVRAAGGRAEMSIIRGNGGHFDGLNEIAQVADVIQDFLARD